jgi:hypothetical protein
LKFDEGVRWPGALNVDGHDCSDRVLLGHRSTVRADEFAFALEPVGTQLGRM